MLFPQLGFGTFRIKGQQITDLVEEALNTGYRHIDTAQFYENEADIGKALASTSVARDDYWVTTKVWYEKLKHQDVLDSLKQSRDNLQVDTIDMALIHWPSPDGVPLKESLDALMEAREQKLIGHFGVSNFTTQLMQQSIDHVGADNIATNQIELHPFLQNQKVCDFCDQHDISVTAYMPLAVGKVMEDATIKRIAADHDASAAQVALAWLMHHNRVVIPSTTKVSHLHSNFKAQQLSLSEDEVVAIDKLDRNDRIVDPDFAPDWDE